MSRRIRSHLTFANIAAGLALVIALGTGTAYAANTVFSADIVDGEVKTPDIASNAVGTGKIGNNHAIQRSYAVSKSTWLVRAVATSGTPEWQLTGIATCAF